MENWDNVNLSPPMKYIMKSLAGSFQFSQNRNERTKCTSLNFPLLALAAGLVLAAGPAQAQPINTLLVNPSFETNSTIGQVVPFGWTYFAPPTLPAGTKDYWVATQISSGQNFAPHSGTYFWKEWGALYSSAVSNVAGIYQTFGSSPGSIYQASGWIATSAGDTLGADCYTWLQVEFLGAGSNVLALYKSDNFSASVGTGTWFPYSVTDACDLTQPVATGDPYFTTYAVTGSVSQLVAPLGTTSVRYRYCFFQAGKEGGSAYFDDAVLDQVSGPVPPSINYLYPQNMIFVAPSNGISFNVSSPSGFTINNSGIQLVLNGTNVSGSLAISGSSSNKTVTYSGLQSNTTYNVSVTVMDSFNLSASANTYFETTWVGVPAYTYLWEAEDWDFNSGMYIDNPDLCNACCETTCYFGQVGVEFVDELNVHYGLYHVYRPDDYEGTAQSGDYSRPNLFAAGRTDYCINPFNSTEWVNYTRDWPNSTNWIIARLATDVGLSGSVTLSLVNPDLTTTNLGTFTINGGLGWTAYEYVYLKDASGNNANVILNGTETLQFTSGGNLLPTFYMLVPAVLDLPLLSNLNPTGTHPFEPANTLSFTVATLGATFPANGIKVILDGYDVSAGLVITGSASSNNVVYPTLQLNAVHTAIITVTNSLGHGISVTNQFDTFSQTNYSFEAEDFDYNGGQYVSASDWQPDAYAGFTSFTNIDFQHTYVSGEPTDGSEYQYRPNGIPQQLLNASGALVDYVRQIFVNTIGAKDYYLYWFGGSDWANYTRVYPTGNFYVYARSAGAGTNSMYLDQVVSGAGTTNQVTKRLGQFYAVNNEPFDWVPLTDDGLVAPVVVNVGGANTLRISTTTGNCYPNFFMLVQTSGIRLSAARAGNNASISFPTQVGATYRVFYRANLTTGNWILLTNLLGDGTVKSVSDPLTGSQRFYKVTSP
jgi:hypothetical protein